MHIKPQDGSINSKFHGASSHVKILPTLPLETRNLIFVTSLVFLF